MNRENAKLVIVAVFCLVVGLAAPAVSATVQHALYADKAGKVDNRDAVGAGASMTQRRGKLVATSATTGRLPNNIIAKAPDAASLGGFTHAQLRTVTVPTGAMWVNAPATLDGSNGILLPDGVLSQIATDFVVPADHVTAHEIRAELIVYHVTACTALFNRFGTIVTAGTGSFNGSGWRGSDGSIIEESQALPAGYSRLSFTLDEPAPPGTVVRLVLTRHGADTLDTCDGTQVVLSGLQFRY